MSSPISSPSGSTGTGGSTAARSTASNPDQLDRLTEEERVEAGVDAYDPDEVPPATDTPPLTEDVRQTEVYQEEQAEIRREEDKGEIYPIDEDHPFPPTRYDD